MARKSNTTTAPADTAAQSNLDEQQQQENQTQEQQENQTPDAQPESDKPDANQTRADKAKDKQPEADKAKDKQPEGDKPEEGTLIGVPDPKAILNGPITGTLESLLLDINGKAHADHVTALLGCFDKELSYNALLLQKLLDDARKRMNESNDTDQLGKAFKAINISLKDTLRKFIGKGGRYLLMGLEEKFNTRRTDFGNTKEGMRPYLEAQVGGVNAIGAGISSVKHEDGKVKVHRTGFGVYVRNSSDSYDAPSL